MIKLTMFSTAGFMLCSVISSTTYAECTINSKFPDGLSTIFREKGYELKNYESICQKLKKANVGLKINTQSMITTEQTTAAVMVRLYPIELAQKYDLLLSTSSSSTGMNANAGCVVKEPVQHQNCFFINTRAVFEANLTILEL